MKKTLILLLLVQMSLSAYCQTITFTTLTGGSYISGIGTINIVDGWTVNGPSPFFLGNAVIQAITYHPNGKLYAANMGVGQLFEMDSSLVNGELLIYAPSTFGFWMNSSPEGKIYTTLGYGLRYYDLATNEWQALGPIGLDGNPYFLHSTMTCINGELYACAWGYEFPYSKNIVKVNLDDPLYSEFVFEMPTTRTITGMTTFNYDCDSTVTYLALQAVDGPTIIGYDIYQFNEKEPSLTFVTYLTGITITDFANPTEHLQFDCTPILDLNGQDTTSINFQADKACVMPGQPAYPFGSAAAGILTNTIVDSIWIGIVGGGLDGTAESLGCDGGSFATCSASNGGLMLYNTGQASNADLLDWFRQSIFYQNTAISVSEGIRQLAVVAYNHDYPSDTAFVWLPVQPGISAVGTVVNASSPSAADGSIAVGSLTGSGNYQFLWSNGGTTQYLTDIPAGSYSLTITDGTGCTAALTFSVDGASAVGEAFSNPFGAVIAPNPSGNAGIALLVKSPSNGLAWRVFDATGRLIETGLTYGSSSALPNGLPPGIYHVELFDNQHRVQLRWVVTR